MVGEERRGRDIKVSVRPQAHISRLRSLLETQHGDFQHLTLRGEEQLQQQDPVRRAVQGVRGLLLWEALRDIRV